MARMSTTTQENSRLATIRRIYFYLVFLASLIAGIVACNQLLRVLSEIWFGNGWGVSGGQWVRNAIASNAGVLVVATPIFLLHWGYSQRRLDSPAERSAAMRKFALYAASAVALGYALFAVYDLLSGIAYLAFGGPTATSEILPGDWLHLALMAAISAALLGYFHNVLLQDGDYGREEGIAGVWRRIYQAAAGLVGLILIIFGSAGILEAALQTLVDWVQPSIGAQLWRAQLSDGLAMLIIGAVVVRVNWRRWQAIIDAYPDEGSTGLRRFYLYAAVVISALTALAPSAMLLRELLLILFGSGSGSLVQLLTDLTTPLAYIPVGIIAWLWYRRYLQQEAEQYGDSEESVTVRRIYAYRVAAPALGLVWYGAVEIVGSFIDWQFGPAGVMDGRDIWLEPLATGLSLLIVAAPVWAIHWRSVQSIARQDDAEGAIERASWPRRAYLYGVALVSALFFLYYLAQVIYRIFLWLLGDPTAGIVSAQMAADIARSTIAAIIWAYHMWAIHVDGQMTTAVPETLAEPSDEDPRQPLLDRIAALKEELTAAEEALAKLDSEE